MPENHLKREPRHRPAVRLLFLTVALYFLLGLGLRKRVGEIYPGLLMPSFAGIGLESMSGGEGVIVAPRITVFFSDQSSSEVTLTQLSGNAFFPSVLVSKFFARDADSTFRPLDAQAVDYLRRRMQQLFPGKTPTKVTIRMNREKFPLDRPNDLTVLATVAARDIVFP